MFSWWGMKFALRVGLLWGVIGCSPSQPPAYAVGTVLGGGSFLTGPSPCTYEGPTGVAEFWPDRRGARLVGEGVVKETCGNQVEMIEIVRPTGLFMEGPDTLKVGATSENSFRVGARAGSRLLSGKLNPEWSLAEDCRGVAEFGPVLGSQDTGGPATWRNLVTVKPGSCTVTARALGMSVSKTVQVR